MLTFLVEAIRLGMTFLLGSTGETLTEKSGHLNLGIPGVMCVGASCGCFAEYLYLKEILIHPRYTPNFLEILGAVLIPLAAAFIGGAIIGWIFSFLTVTLRANQNVTGLALTTLGVGLSNFIISKADAKIYAKGSAYFTATLPLSEELGWFGKLFFSYGVFAYLAIIIALLCSFVLNHTRIGLHLRAVGENPATADAAGINVTRYRYGATCIGCGIAGLGGLSFIMDYLSGNWEYCIDAIGWLCIALVIFTAWKPGLGILGSILFGALYCAADFATGVGFAEKELFKMLPYVVTLIVLIVTSMRKKREHQPPAGLGLPYFREER